MGMGQKYNIDVGSGNRKLRIFIDVGSLLHPAVHGQPGISDFQKMTAAGYFMICPDKC